MTRVSKSSPKNNSETNKEEILREKYVPLELRKKNYWWPRIKEEKLKGKIHWWSKISIITLVIKLNLKFQC